MRAISIHQPWAWLILNGGKNYENRSRPTKYLRERVMIHSPVKQSFAVAIAFMRRAKFDPDLIGRVSSLTIDEAPSGGVIVGSLVFGSCEPVVGAEQRPLDWRIPGGYAYSILDAKPLVAQAGSRGRLGIWETGMEIGEDGLLKPVEGGP